jgi:Rhodanese-like domain
MKCLVSLWCPDPERNDPDLGRVFAARHPGFYVHPDKEGGGIMKNRLSLKGVVLALLPLSLALTGAGGVLAVEAPKNIVAKKCMACHKEYKDMADIVAGDFNSLSKKANSIAVKIEDEMQLVKFTAETTVKNVPEIKNLKSPIPVRVHYKRVGDDLVALQIVAKPEIKVPQGQLISTEEMEKLVAAGPEKGNFTLIDSRPGIKYQEGHIPGAISIPFPKMAEMKNKLPQDKNRLMVFYCEGFR